jgi:hypothetical protein
MFGDGGLRLRLRVSSDEQCGHDECDGADERGDNSKNVRSQNRSTPFGFDRYQFQSKHRGAPMRASQ